MVHLRVKSFCRSEQTNLHNSKPDTPSPPGSQTWWAEAPKAECAKQEGVSVRGREGGKYFESHPKHYTAFEREGHGHLTSPQEYFTAQWDEPGHRT